MTRYRVHNNQITPAIPTIFLYDNDGNIEVTSSGIWLTWDTVEVKTSHFNYVADDDRIQLNTNSSGFMSIEVDCSFITYNEDDDKYVTVELYKNGSALNGSKTVTGITGAGSQTAYILNNQSLHYIVYLEKDDYLQVKASTSAGTAYTLSDTSRILITFIPMQGWNNSSGGRTDYKGGVLR